MPVEMTLAEMLEARECRAQHQRELLKQYHGTLISFTMNISGPQKDSERIRQGFRRGRQMLEQQLKLSGIPLCYQEERHLPSGWEGYFMTEAPARQIKELTAELEESSALGRLFDFDVIRPDGTKVSRTELGLPVRKCLLCGLPAASCARSRAHTVPELQTVTHRILGNHFRQETADRISALACQALSYEVCVTPKPGLVDRRNSGAHQDMDIFSFMAGISSLGPYFRRCVLQGMDAETPEDAFTAIRWPGKQAEQNMYQATGGVNTHKGAIFSMGILCGALGRLWEGTPDTPFLCQQAAAMAARLQATPSVHAGSATPGERYNQEYGVAGVRGAVSGGFREVLETGLPTLKAMLKAGRSLNDAGAIALYHLLGVVTDTNLIHRSSYARQQELQAELEAAAVRDPVPSMETLEALDQDFIRENLSPGGCADLLAITWFLWLLEQNGFLRGKEA